MSRFVKVFCHLLTVYLVCSTFTDPVKAMPPLPSGFYGTVMVNGQKVPDGTQIQALIGDQVFATAYTQTYQDSSVYSLNVPGDDTDTPQKDGGREQDTIRFEIGGAEADQTGTWASGTNERIDLSASAFSPIDEPGATPSPIPTQTPILIESAGPTPTATNRPSTIPTLKAQTGSTATLTVRLLSANGEIDQPFATAARPTQAAPAPISSADSRLITSPIASNLDLPTPSSLAVVRSNPTEPPPGNSPEGSLEGAPLGTILGVMAIPVLGLIAWGVTRGINNQKRISRPD